MAYRLPSFNLSVNIWRAFNMVVNPPDVVTVGNLSPGKRTMPGLPWIAGTNAAAMNTMHAQGGLPMELLLPAFTDIRYGSDPGLGLDNPDIVEVPAGSSRYYVVVGVDDVAKGFANEYRIAIMYPATAFVLLAFGNPWNAPTPFYPIP